MGTGHIVEEASSRIDHHVAAGHHVIKLEAVETSDQMRRARVKGSDYRDKRRLLVSWPLLLDRLAAAVPPDSLVASDIRQIRGLAQREEDEAFQPIMTAELSLSVPRRLRWLHRLIDDVVDSRGCREGWMTVEGFRATPQQDGYGRNFGFTTDLGEVIPGSLFLCVDFRLWASSGDTPLWLRIYSDVPINSGQLRGKVPSMVEDEGTRGHSRRASLPDARSGIRARAG